MQVANIVTGVLLARMLGPAGKGVLTAILLWPGLVVAILSFGIYESVTYYAAVEKSRGRQIAGAAILIAMVQSAIAVAAWLAILPLVLAHYGAGIVTDGRIFALWIPTYLVSVIAMGVLLGRMEIGLYNGLRLAQTLLVTISLLMLAILQSRNLTIVLVVYLAAHLVSAIVSVGLVASKGGMGLPSDLGIIKRLISFGMKSHIGTISGLANERADLAVIALFLPAIALGFYSVAVTVAAPVLMLGSSLASVAMPAVASAATPSERHDRAARFARLTVALSFATALAGVVLGPWLIVIFFGPAFAPAGVASQVLFAAAVPLSANRVLGSILKAHNKPLRTGLAELVALAATIVCLTILLPIWGIVGAAVASGVAYLVSSAVLIVGLRRIGYRVTELLIPTPADVKALLAHLPRTAFTVVP
jgi:O-antigen/teichoic acid export membrane protein